MEISILGTGHVGGALGRRWASLGHQVVFGSRDPSSEKVTDLIGQAGENARAATLADAAKSGGVLVIALPWLVLKETLATIEVPEQTIVVDCTNPLNAQFNGLDLGYTTSAAEQIAGWLPGTRVVKAFNTVSAAAMADPDFNGQPATMFYCGDDEQARDTVGELAGQLGLEAVDAGPLSIARYLEPLAMLYIHLAISKRWGSSCAFKVMQR